MNSYSLPALDSIPHFRSSRGERILVKWAGQMGNGLAGSPAASLGTVGKRLNALNAQAREDQYPLDPPEEGTEPAGRPCPRLTQ